MADIQSFDELYNDLCQHMATQLPHINHQDLYHEQVNFLDTEHPWEAPALFYDFRGVPTGDLGELAQELDLQVDVYLFYETFLDTAYQSHNSQQAIDYLKDLTTINAALHGYSSAAVDNMRRVAFGRVNTGGAGNLYRVTFTAHTRDHSAVKGYNGETPGELAISDFMI
jgi:hypothetical protein